MSFTVQSRAFRPATVEAAVVAVREGATARSHPWLARLDAGRPFVDALFKAAGFRGEADRTLVHQPLTKGLPTRLVFVGLGAAGAVTEESHRRAGAHAARLVGSATKVAWLFDDEDDLERAAEAVATGFRLATYRFDRYLSSAKKERRRPPSLALVGATAGAEARLRAAAAVAEATADGVFFARDLGNLPGNLGTPLVLAREAKAMARREGLRCVVLDEHAIGRLGMGSFLSVSLGSVIPPRFVVLEHGRRRKGVPTIALVGKGLTFDSGGISIKPAAEMDKMRHDKCGAAAVFGAMLAAARLKLPFHLVGLAPCSENMPGRNANKPGDVVRAMNGKTIEILNTDAEGRLILADALCYAERFDPDYVVDLATLTGSCAATFGNHVTGLFGVDDGLCDRLFAAGQATFERVWRLPLYDDYDQMMKGTTTDLKNLGGPRGGAIAAAAFLRHFTHGRKWAHLDVAGTAWDDAQRPYNAGAGASGVGVRLLVRMLRDWNGPASAAAPRRAGRGAPSRRRR